MSAAKLSLVSGEQVTIDLVMKDRLSGLTWRTSKTSKVPHATWRGIRWSLSKLILFLHSQDCTGKTIIHANGDQTDFTLSNLELTDRTGAALKSAEKRRAKKGQLGHYEVCGECGTRKFVLDKLLPKPKSKIEEDIDSLISGSQEKEELPEVETGAAVED